MKITPMTEREVAELGLLTPGLYDFEIVRAKDGHSKKGAEMITLGVKCFHPDGNLIVSSWLVNQEGFAQRNIRRFAAATGLLEKYEAGELTSEDCVGRTGKCTVKIREADRGPENSIADFKPAEESDASERPETTVVSPKVPIEDDDLPF